MRHLAVEREVSTADLWYTELTWSWPCQWQTVVSNSTGVVDDGTGMVNEGMGGGQDGTAAMTVWGVNSNAVQVYQDTALTYRKPWTW
jgi:hypothetical protein